jgi:hypothetical protein
MDGKQTVGEGKHSSRRCAGTRLLRPSSALTEAKLLGHAVGMEVSALARAGLITLSA